MAEKIIGTYDDEAEGCYEGGFEQGGVVKLRGFEGLVYKIVP